MRTATPLARRCLRTSLLTLLVLLAAPQPPGAEQADPAAADAAKTPPPVVAEPAVIPAAQVATRWRSTQAVLQTIREGASESDTSLAIRSQLDALEEEIPPAAAEASTTLTKATSPDRLIEVEGTWKKRAAQLDTWSNELASRVTKLSDDLAELDSLEGPWHETEDAATGNLAQPLIDRIRSTLTAIHDTRAVVRERQNAVLVLQDRLAKLTQDVATVLAQVKSVRRAQQQNLLVVDSVPLWAAVGRSDFQVGELGLPITAAVRQASAYFDSNSRNAGFFVLIVVVTILGVFALRSKAVGWAEQDESLAPVLTSLSRPVSGGFLVAAITFPWIFRDRPEVVAGLLSLIVIPPLIHFLAPLVSPAVRRALFALAAWLVVNLIRTYLLPDPLVNRLTLLGEDIAVLGVVLWLLRPKRLEDLQGNASTLLWLLGLGMRITALLLAVAIVANVAGNVTLARMLTQALVNSLFTAAVLGAALRVLEFVLVALLHSHTARRLRMVRRRGRFIRERAIRALRVALGVFWFWLSLRQFQVAETFYDYATSILAAPIGAGDFNLTLGHLFGAILVVVVSVYLARIVRFVLDEDVMPRTSLPRGVPYTVSVLAGYGIILLGSFAAVAAAGIDMSRFALVLSALSVGIGIGLQGVVNNFVSGLILLFERPLKVGDTVEVDDVRGEIRRIGLRSTTVRTWDGSESVIPNGQFIGDKFTNWTLSDQLRRIQIDVGVAYGTDPERVVEVLKEIAEANPRVMEAPAPRALMTAFGESSLNFQLRAWTEDMGDWTGVRSELTIAINAKLAEVGIVIPFPQRDLHLKEGSRTSGTEAT